jgi:hypothetical protein
MSTGGKHDSEPNFKKSNRERNREAIRLVLFYVLVAEAVCLGVLNLRANESGMDLDGIDFDRKTHIFETRNLGSNVVEYGWPAIYRKVRYQGNINDHSSRTVVRSVSALMLNLGVAVYIVLLTHLLLGSIWRRRFYPGIAIALVFGSTLAFLLILAAKSGL